MPERPSIGADVVEAAIAAFESAPEHNSDRDPDTTNRVAMGLAIREALDKLGLREQRTLLLKWADGSSSRCAENAPEASRGRPSGPSAPKSIVRERRVVSDWRPVDAEPTSTACPDCVEGRTHDVQDGEPVVETCASCRGTGKSVRVDAEPSKEGAPEVAEALRAEAHLPDADQAAREYDETRKRVIEGRASVQEAQGFIDFLEEAIPHPPWPSATSEGEPRG